MTRLCRILLHYDFTPVELFLALYSVVWGLGVFLPSATLDGPAYGLIRRLTADMGLSEDVWGALVFGIGSAGIMAVVWPKRKMRHAASFLQTVWWA